MFILSPRERTSARSLCDAMKTTFKIGHSKPKRTYYVCDRKKCDYCAAGCKHTTDIDHALYEEHTEFTPEQTGLWERVRDGKA